MIDIPSIQTRLLSLSPYVKEVQVVIQEGFAHAVISPDFEALKSASIVTIENELKWYCIELYNMEAKEEEKIRSYTILKDALSDKETDIDDELYKTLKSFLSTISKSEIFPSSHLELDLGLDSLNYVALFVFVQESFGVHIDEVIFSNIMRMRDFYAYIKNTQKWFAPTQTEWKEILSKGVDEELIYSPFIISLYKTLLLPFFKLYFRLELTGLENLPKSACIIAPNHQSMLDGFLIESSLPYAVLKNTFFVAYEAVFGTKYLRPVSKHGQTLLIDANNHLLASMRRCALPLKHKKNLVIFPEGARTRDKELLEFRPFFAMLAKTYNTPVTPVVIEGSFEALRAGKLFPKSTKIRIAFLNPIYPEQLSFEEITKRTKDAIQNHIKQNTILR